MRNLTFAIFLISFPSWALDLTKDVKKTLENVLTSERALQLNFGGSEPAISLLKLGEKENFVVIHDKNNHSLEEKKYSTKRSLAQSSSESVLNSGDNFSQSGLSFQPGPTSGSASVFLNSSQSISGNQFFSSQGNSSLKNNEKPNINLKADQYAQFTRDVLDKFTPDGSLEKSSVLADYSELKNKKSPSLNNGLKTNDSFKVARNIPSPTQDDFKNIKETFPGILLPAVSDSPTNSAGGDNEAAHSHAAGRQNYDLPAGNPTNESTSHSATQQIKDFQIEPEESVGEVKSQKRDNSPPASSPKKTEEVYAYHEKSDDFVFQSPKKSTDLGASQRLEINEPIKPQTLSTDNSSASLKLGIDAPLKKAEGSLLALDSSFSTSFDDSVFKLRLDGSDNVSLLDKDFSEFFHDDFSSKTSLGIDEPLKIKSDAESTPRLSNPRPSLFASAQPALKIEPSSILDTSLKDSPIVSPVLENPIKLSLGAEPTQKTAALQLGLDSPTPSKSFGDVLKEVNSISPLNSVNQKTIKTITKTINCDEETKDFQRKYQPFLAQFKKVSRKDGEGYCYNVSTEKNSFDEKGFKKKLAELQGNCEHLVEKALVNPSDVDRSYCVVLKKESNVSQENKNQYRLLSDALNPQSVAEPTSNNQEATHAQ